MGRFAVIDTETTGLGIFDRVNPRHDDYPISIGMLIAEFDEDKKAIRCIDSMHSLIRIPNPERAEDTALIHGIMPEDLEDAPSPREVCDAVTGLCGDHGLSVAAAWNHRFDKYFVDRLYSLGKAQAPGFTWFELQPAKMARLSTYTKKVVAREDVLCLPAHHALCDCVRALAVFATMGGHELDLSGVRFDHENDG